MLKRTTTCIAMDQLRVYIYHHSKGITLDQLPPTSYAIQQHIRRAYYATYQMVTLLHLGSTKIIKPTNFGFKQSNGLLLPIKGIRQIPKEYSIVCNCKNCSNDSCTWFEARLPCIFFCKCRLSQNNDQTAQCKISFGSIKPLNWLDPWLRETGL